MGQAWALWVNLVLNPCLNLGHWIEGLKDINCWLWKIHQSIPQLDWDENLNLPESSIYRGRIQSDHDHPSQWDIQSDLIHWEENTLKARPWGEILIFHRTQLKVIMIVDFGGPLGWSQEENDAMMMWMMSLHQFPEDMCHHLKRRVECICGDVHIMSSTCGGLRVEQWWCHV